MGYLIDYIIVYPELNVPQWLTQTAYNIHYSERAFGDPVAGKNTLPVGSKVFGEPQEIPYRSKYTRILMAYSRKEMFKRNDRKRH